MADRGVVASGSDGARGHRRGDAATIAPLERTPTAALRRLIERLPWWAVVLAVFAASRVVTTVIMLGFADRQRVNAWTGASPGYFDFASLWDGHWYFIIAMTGYPVELPRTEDGHVAENAWAFMPVYPFLARTVMVLTGAPFDVVAVLLSVGFAAAAALVLHRLVTVLRGEGTATAAVALFSFNPLSPVLQVAYAESMHAFLLVIALYLLVRRRYAVLLPVIAVMALTRPSGLAFALCLGLHVVYRWFRRDVDPFPLSERVGALLACVVSGLMGLSWLVIAWAVTGSFTAYTDTELAWRAPYIGYQHLVPFAPWIQGANWWNAFWGLPPGTLLVLLLLLVGGFAAFLFSPAARGMGADLRFWLASYALYLLAVFFPQSSTFRLLLPLFPVVVALAAIRSPWWRTALIVAGILGQIGWVHVGWWVDGYDWTPP